MLDQLHHGKTSLSIELAKKIDGEIISADSMQIYKDMQIGTAKVTKEEMEGIKHYLVDFVSPAQRYTVSNFKEDCENAIKTILSRGKIPIIVGGTGLYINSIIYGIDYPEMHFDQTYRDELMKEAQTEEGLKRIYDKALEIDPKAMSNISFNDKKRIIRILEIYNFTGKTKTEQEIDSKKNGIKYDFRKFAITWNREELYRRINLRVDIMLEQGLINEVKEWMQKYKKHPTAYQAIGYKEVVEYLNGKVTYDEMVEKIKIETRHYAKRQLTWFRKNNDYIWLYGEDGNKKNVDIIFEDWRKS